MINDNKGLFFSLDVVLAIIPIFILILNVTNINIDYTPSYLTKHYFMEA